MQQKIILASHNAGKIKEFNELFQSISKSTQSQYQVVSQSEYFLDEVEETGLSFIENAILKARYASDMSGLPAIADDSGLEVDYLKGAPGIYSARYSMEKTDSSNNIKLLAAMKMATESESSARFRCVLVYLRHALDPSPLIAEGRLDGIILKRPRGDHGFGYDPLLWLPAYGQTVAELSPELKNQISHRAQALKKLMNALAVGG